MNEKREALAKLIWESSVAWSNPNRLGVEWATELGSASRQKARYIADTLISAGYDTNEDNA